MGIKERRRVEQIYRKAKRRTWMSRMEPWGWRVKWMSK